LLVFVFSAFSLATEPVLSQGSSPFTEVTRLFDRDHWVLVQLCEEAGDDCSETTIKKYGFRLNRLPGGLREGERVSLYAPGSTAPQLICWNRCSLYFLDLVPGALFAHPTVIGLYDRVTGDLQMAKGQWWPIIDGNRHVFDTSRSRAESSIAEWDGMAGLPDMRSKPTPLVYSPEVSIKPPQTQIGQSAMDSLPPCGVHAVVVNGYRDRYLNFEHDAEGMYAVLKGLGVPDENIVFLSPFDSPKRDYKTTVNNLKAAIASLAAATHPPQPICAEFVFFLSTHGDSDPQKNGTLELRSGSGAHWWIAGNDLATWLSEVNCSKSTIIINSCSAASFQSAIEGAMTAQTDVGQQRSLQLFLSSEIDEYSWPDRDIWGVDGEPCNVAEDPNCTVDSNTEDVGSETVWGYVEAFGTSEADNDPADGKISFSEAAKYAIAKDVTKRHSVVSPSPHTDQSAAHSCCAFDTNAMTILPACGLATKQKKSVAGYGKTQVVKRCTNAPLWITVRNVGGSTIPVGTLRLFGSVVSQDDDLPEHLTALANVALVTDFVPNEQRTYKLHWGVRPVFKKGDRVALFASLDSPVDPTGGKELCVEDGPGPSACRAEEHSCLCEVSVVKRCFPIIGCNCRKYAPPEFLPPPE
jgi:hypothetical protein